MEKTPQKPKMIRSGSGTKKKKSIEQPPVVVQGNTFRLNSRIEVLQNAIKNKEQRLNISTEIFLMINRIWIPYKED